MLSTQGKEYPQDLRSVPVECMSHTGPRAPDKMHEQDVGEHVLQARKGKRPTQKKVEANTHTHTNDNNQ